jgi:hypothetical protein
MFLSISNCISRSSGQCSRWYRLATILAGRLADRARSATCDGLKASHRCCLTEPFNALPTGRLRHRLKKEGARRGRAAPTFCLQGRQEHRP